MKGHYARWVIAGLCAALAALGLGVAGESRQGRGERLGGADEPAGAPGVEGRTLRVYNIADLIWLGGERSYARGLRLATQLNQGIYAPPWSSGLFEVVPQPGEDAPTAAGGIDGATLVTVIEELLGEEPFERRRLRFLGPTLIAYETASGHARIAQLLQELREKVIAVPTLRIEARWVRLTAEQLARLAGGAGGKPAPLAAPTELLKDVTEVARGTIACLDRQAVRLLSGRGESVVEDLDPIVSEYMAAFDPMMANVFWGPALWVAPALSGDGRLVTVSVSSIVGKRRSVQRVEVPMPMTATRPAAVTEGFVDRVDYDVDAFATTLTMPVGKPVLVGGVTGSDQAEGKGLHLILTVTVRK